MMIFLWIFIMFMYAGYCNGGMDAIKYKTNKFCFQSDWWLSRGKYTPGNRSWLKKYIFFFLADGWHTLKFIMVLLLSVAVAGAVFYTPEVRPEDIFISFALAYFGFSLGHFVGYETGWIKWDT